VIVGLFHADVGHLGIFVSGRVAKKEHAQIDPRQLNKLERRDEKPFEVVADVSRVGEKAYSRFMRPFVRPLVNEGAAELARWFHPLRWQRWAFSDINPMLWSLPALASQVKADRQAAPPENPYRRREGGIARHGRHAEPIPRSRRDVESQFFRSRPCAATWPRGCRRGRAAEQDRELRWWDALAAIGTGSYPRPSFDRAPGLKERGFSRVWNQSTACPR
jgi:hypothetical protein